LRLTYNWLAYVGCTPIIHEFAFVVQVSDDSFEVILDVPS
jgi:hypothetical protein